MYSQFNNVNRFPVCYLYSK